MPFTYTTRPRKHGSTQTTIDVERDGKPFGQLWTWPNTKTDTHPWHSKPLNGEHEAFYAPTGKPKAAALALAKEYMEAHG